MGGRALVIGLGTSGRAAAKLLLTEGYDVHGFDSRPTTAPSTSLTACHLGGVTAPAAAYASIDLLILSPGVPPGPHRALAQEHSPNARVTGELALALELAHQRWPDTPTVLITGTNGKSTVTAMLGHLLEHAGMEPFVGGNLGVPLSAQLLKDSGHSPPGALVLECSSYQLETLATTPVDIAMVLNVSPDHLDRYDGLDHYAQTKGRIFSGLVDGGLALTYAPDPRSRAFLPTSTTAAHVLVGGSDAPRLDERGHLHIDDSWTLPREVLPLAGQHNAVNALFALAAARHLGLSDATCEAGLRTFSGLPHRMQLVAEHAGIAYYDDSKATNVASVVAMLDGFERPVVLIAGGRAKKGDDLAPIANILSAQGRGLVAIGEAKQAMLEMARGVVPTQGVETVAEAVLAAQAMAQPGDAIVLSPACASWDMFESFAHRGRAFREAVQQTISAAPSDASIT